MINYILVSHINQHFNKMSSNSQSQASARHEDEQTQEHNEDITPQFSWCVPEIIIHFLRRDKTHISSILVSLNKPKDPEVTEDKTGSDIPGMKPIKQDFTPHVSLCFVYFIIKTQL